jgi:hypothetical protein
MAGGATSPPIWRAAFNMLVPGATSIVMLSIVTLKFVGLVSSLIIKIQKSKFKSQKALYYCDFTIIEAFQIQKSKFKSQKAFYHRDFTIIDAIIFEISLTSTINLFISSFDTSTVSLIKHNQYLVSFADFRAMA